MMEDDDDRLTQVECASRIRKNSNQSRIGPSQRSLTIGSLRANHVCSRIGLRLSTSGWDNLLEIEARRDPAV